MGKSKKPSLFSELNDAELVARYKEAGDQRFLAELYQRYSGLILGTSFKYLKNKDEARDASADIYEELVTKLLENEVKFFKSWLYRLVVNHCLMKLRKINPFSGAEFDEEKIEDQFVESASFEHLTEEQDKEILLKNAMDGLDVKQRLCVEKFFLLQKSYKEISQETGYDFNQVKSYIQNGLRNLRNSFKTRQ